MGFRVRVAVIGKASIGVGKTGRRNFFCAAMRVNERIDAADHQRNATSDTRAIVPAGVKLPIDVQPSVATILNDWAAAKEAYLP